MSVYYQYPVVGFCEVPKVNHSIDVQPAPGFFVAHHTAILVRCESGYILYDATEPLCQDGVWSHTPQCIRGESHHGRLGAKGSYLPL